MYENVIVLVICSNVQWFDPLDSRTMAKLFNMRGLMYLDVDSVVIFLFSLHLISSCLDNLLNFPAD